MISTLLSLLVYVIVIGLIVWLIIWVLDQFPLPEPFGRIARILVIAFAAIALIYLLLSLIGGVPTIRPVP